MAVERLLCRDFGLRYLKASKEAESLDPGEFAVPICSTSIALRECIHRAMRLGWKALDESASNEILSFALSLN